MDTLHGLFLSTPNVFIIIPALSLGIVLLAIKLNRPPRGTLQKQAVRLGHHKTRLDR